MTTLVEGTRRGEFIVSEANGTLSREVVTIAAGAGVITAGMVLGKVAASGKWKPYDDDNADGSETAAAIAYDGVDATSVDRECVVIFRLAEVKLSALVFAAGNDAAGILSGLTDLAQKNVIAR